MSDADQQLGWRVVHEMALAVLQGEGDLRADFLRRYGEWGFECAEQVLLESEWHREMHQMLATPE